MNSIEEIKKVVDEIENMEIIIDNLVKQKDAKREELKQAMIKMNIKKCKGMNKTAYLGDKNDIKYDYSLLENEIKKRGLFDKVTKTTIITKAMTEAVECGDFPAEIADTAKTSETKKVLTMRK